MSSSQEFRPAAEREYEAERDGAAGDATDAAGERSGVRREIVIEASPAEIWEALVTEEGRERWLADDDAEREIRVEIADEPERLVWWWSQDGGVATRVEFRVLAVPAGARVIVTESAPRLPLSSLVAAFALVRA